MSAKRIISGSIRTMFHGRPDLVVTKSQALRTGIHEFKLRPQHENLVIPGSFQHRRKRQRLLADFGFVCAAETVSINASL